MKKFSNFTVLFFMMILTSCSKELINTDPEPFTLVIEEQNRRLSKMISVNKKEVFLRVLVTDEQGEALKGVEISAANQFSQTDEYGFAFFDKILINKDYALVTAQKPGYLKGNRTIYPTEKSMNTVTITLLKEGVPKKFMATQGGNLNFENNKINLAFIGSTIKDESGNAYHGEVNVYSRYLDPGADNFTAVMPGTLVGLSGADNLEGMISYGMINVEMRDAAGKPLQLADGKTARITMPAVLDAPEHMPVWHFNETYGLWVEAGRATKEGNNYIFDANHFSSWNLDVMTPDAISEVIIEVVDKENRPIGNQSIEIYTEGFVNRLLTVTTDENGRFRLIRTPRQLGFRFIFPCEHMDVDVTLVSPITRVMAPCPDLASAYRVEGVLKDCDEVLYSNSFFFLQGIDRGDIQFIGKTGDDGKYSISNLLCYIDNTKSYLMEAIVSEGNGRLKRDTVEIYFDKPIIELDINFCINVEEEDTYPPGTLHCNGIPTAVIGVTNPVTGKIWMDRNLGASRAALSSTDSLAYGDLYQWGRGPDGHQCRYSPTKSTLSSTDQPGHGDFVLAINSPFIDWRSPENMNLWQGVNGVNNPCPIGFRLPTEAELNAERISWSSDNAAGAFASLLKLPMAGARSPIDGLPGEVGTLGFYWSSTASSSFSSGLFFKISNIGMVTTYRAGGHSVRCIKD